MMRIAKRRAPALRSDERTRTFRLGLGLYVGVVLLLAALAVKPQLTSMLAPGDTVTAEFSSSYKLRAYDSSVKLAGIEVGSVTDIETTGHDTVLVTMKVDHHVLDKLGSRPTARIEPRTLLGGRYAIELHPGGTGDFDRAIPLERTGTPVELDAVLEALPATAREGLQGLVGETGPALKDARRPLSHLLETAPGVLRPGADVVSSARGTRPGRDLPELVSNLSTTADVLTRSDAQLDAIAEDLYQSSVVLHRHRGALAATLHDLPQTIHGTRQGLTGLDGSIDRLRTTAAALRPSAPKVVDLLDELDPLLRDAGPLLADLKPMLRDTRPAVRRLVPVARQATGVLQDLHGPVLDRVNGPVVDFVMNPWKGTGPYADSAKGYLADHKFYEELAYMATNIDRASMSQDQRGSTLAFQAGVGLSSIDGLPFDLESIVEMALRHAGITDPVLRRAALLKAGVTP
jgi:phospholipid/cholesterol/gamma-HCH transport system substrate-binding protein